MEVSYTAPQEAWASGCVMAQVRIDRLTDVPAALLNAAHDALWPLGPQQLDFPLTPERLWRAMRASAAAASG